jgi:hypothetical protein
MARNCLVLEVPQDVVTVANGFNIAQRPVEKRLKVVFVPASSNGIDDLVKVQVAEYLGRFRVNEAHLGLVE